MCRSRSTSAINFSLMSLLSSIMFPAASLRHLIVFNFECFNRKRQNVDDSWMFCCQGVCKAQKEPSCFPPSSSGFEARHGRDFFSLLLSWWTVLRSNQYSAKQWISQMQLAVTSRAEYYKKMFCCQ